MQLGYFLAAFLCKKAQLDYRDYVQILCISEVLI